MSLVGAYVTEITGPPYFKHTKWWLPVKYESYGVPGETSLMFGTKDRALKVKVGHHFLT